MEVPGHILEFGAYSIPNIYEGAKKKLFSIWTDISSVREIIKCLKMRDYKSHEITKNFVIHVGLTF